MICMGQWTPKLQSIIVCSICKQDKPKYVKDICLQCYDKEKIRKRSENSPLIPCADGCGQMIRSISASSGKPTRYVNGHGGNRQRLSDEKYAAMVAKRKENKKEVDKVRDQIITCKTCNQPNKRQYITGMCEACYTRQKRLKRSLNSPLIKCQCGRPDCNEMIHSIGPSGEPVKVKYEHKVGEGHVNFKGGNYPDKDGYRRIRVYGEHPYKDASGSVPEHRLVYEHYLSILFDEQVFLPPNILVHHINEIVDDNRLINLDHKFGNKEHMKEHPMDRYVTSIPYEDRICLLCNSKDTYIIPTGKKKGKPKWYLYENRGFICKICYNKNLRIRKNIDKETST